MVFIQSKLLLRWLRAYHDACPKTKIVTVGYSAGAIITMNVLCGASSSGWKVPGRPLRPKWAKTSESLKVRRQHCVSADHRLVVASVVYGDETYTARQSYNRGTCAQYGGESRFPRKKPEGCAAFQSSMLAYCNWFDPQCCRGRGSWDHFTYFAEYDDEASTFVRQKWLASKS